MKKVSALNVATPQSYELNYYRVNTVQAQVSLFVTQSQYVY